MHIISWNVLADSYSVTDWSQRSLQLRSKLAYLRNYDIICLQEVDHFEDFYQPLFEEMGFGVCYAQRPTKYDGSLVAYRLSKYESVDIENISFDDLALNYRESHSAHNSLLRHNVAVMVLLRALDSGTEGNYILACSTHMYWNPVVTFVMQY